MFIENIKKENIADCAEIYNNYVRDSFFTLEEKELSEEEFEKRVSSVLEGGFPFIVAKDDEKKVKGFAYLDYFNPRSGYRYTADLSVYVACDSRGKNVGATMWEYIKEEAKKMGLKNIISIITSENEASCAFHEKQGFILEGKLNDIAVKFGESHSVSYYRKPLYDDEM